jgi:hypothetical protein
VKRKEILDTARDLICLDRNEQYGEPEECPSGAIANLWSAYLQSPIKPADVAMMLALMKVARMKTGEYNADNYVDAAGYIAIAGEIKGA